MAQLMSCAHPLAAPAPLLALSPGLWRDTADRKIASREKTVASRADRRIIPVVSQGATIDCWLNDGVDAGDDAWMAVGAEQ